MTENLMKVMPALRKKELDYILMRWIKFYRNNDISKLELEQCFEYDTLPLISKDEANAAMETVLREFHNCHKAQAGKSIIDIFLALNETINRSSL